MDNLQEPSWLMDMEVNKVADEVTEVDKLADEVTDMVEDRINFTDVTLVEHVFIQNCISILSKKCQFERASKWGKAM